MVDLVYDVTGIENAARALRELPVAVQDGALARAVNRTGAQTFTQLKRLLAKQSGLKVSRVAQALTKIPATGSGSPTYMIIARDRWTTITAGSFGARGVKAGVRHRAWAKRQQAEGAFMMGSVAVVRTTKDRLPVKAMYGPNVARELVRKDSEAGPTALATVARVLPPRVLHEVDRELKRLKGKYGL